MMMAGKNHLVFGFYDLFFLKIIFVICNTNIAEYEEAS
jgi:hypothetical protein